MICARLVSDNQFMKGESAEVKLGLDSAVPASLATYKRSIRDAY